MAILLYIYILLNLIVAYIYYKREYGVFQFPFLIACVSLTFVTPQLLGIAHYDPIFSEQMIEPLCVFISCNIAIVIGFESGKNKPIKTLKVLIDNKNILSIVGFTVVGSIAYFMNRGVYKGGFVSGIYVIINFFTQYLSYALILALIIVKNGFLFTQYKYKFLVYTLLVLIVIINLDRVILQARRAEAISFVLIIAYFILITKSSLYKKYKILIPLFFVFGLLSGSQIAEYRENSYKGEMSAVQNLNTIHLNLESSLYGPTDGEIKNAILGINDISQRQMFDYGLFNWNNFIGNFVPKALFGEEVKQYLTINMGDDSYTRYLTRMGSTMTGYYDAYRSFGIFSFLKFLFVGFVMGFLWTKTYYSDYYLLPYFGCLTAALHIITHSSGNFVTALFFWGAFIYPFINKKHVDD